MKERTQRRTTPPRIVQWIDKNRLFPRNAGKQDTVVNISFSIDRQVAELARKAAQKRGKNLDQVVGDYVEQLARSAQPRDQWA